MKELARSKVFTFSNVFTVLALGLGVTMSYVFGIAQYLASNLRGEAVAITALLVVLYFGYATRKHNRLTLRPLIDNLVDEGASPEEAMGVYILNNGVGPAIVRKLEVWFGETPIETSSAEEYKRSLNAVGMNSVELNHVHIRCGVALRAGGRIPLFELPKEKADEARKRAFAGFIYNLRFRVKYTSVYEEWWSTVEEFDLSDKREWSRYL